MKVIISPSDNKEAFLNQGCRATTAAAAAHTPSFALYDLPAALVRPPPVAVADGVEVGIARGVAAVGAAAAYFPNVAEDASSLILPMLEQKLSVWVAAAVAADPNGTAALVGLFAWLVKPAHKKVASSYIYGT